MTGATGKRFHVQKFYVPFLLPRKYAWITFRELSANSVRNAFAPTVLESKQLIQQKKRNTNIDSCAFMVWEGRLFMIPLCGAGMVDCQGLAQWTSL